AHLAGSVRGHVGFGRMSIENGFDLASRRDDELRMQETSVPSGAATGRTDGYFDLLGQMRPDLLERPGQLQVRDRAGWVHGDPTELAPDRQLRKQVATPCDRVDDRQTLVPSLGLGIEQWCDVLAETEGARCRIDDDRNLAAVAPPQHGFGDGLGHEPVALGIAFRLPRGGAAQTGDVRRDPQRLSGPFGEYEERLWQGRRSRAVRIAAKHPVDAGGKVDGCR